MTIGNDQYNKIPTQAKAASVAITTEIRDASKYKLLSVVPPITKSLTNSTVFYALVNPKDGVCIAHRIARGDCFYFHECREQKLRAQEARTKAWNDLINAVVARDSKMDGNAPSQHPVNDILVHALLRDFYDTRQPFSEEQS